MTRKVRHALHDILEAIERVDQITRGKTLAEFEQSWQLRWLVQRAIEVISEASRAIPSELTDTRPEIPWPRCEESATSFDTNIRGYRTRLSGGLSLTSCHGLSWQSRRSTQASTNKASAQSVSETTGEVVG